MIEEIKQIILEISDLNQIDKNDLLFEGGPLSSIELLMMIDGLEKKYSIKVLPEELISSNINTIHNISEYVKRKQDGGK